MPLNPFAVRRASAVLERTILAIIAGYVSAVILMVVSVGLFVEIWPELFPNPSTGMLLSARALVLTLALHLFSAGVGGYIAAAIVRENSGEIAVVLGLVIVVLGVLTAFLEESVKPLWWYGVLLVFLLPCTVLGASLRKKK